MNFTDITTKELINSYERFHDFISPNAMKLLDGTIIPAVLQVLEEIGMSVGDDQLDFEYAEVEGLTREEIMQAILSLTVSDMPVGRKYLIPVIERCYGEEEFSIRLNPSFADAICLIYSPSHTADLLRKC